MDPFTLLAIAGTGINIIGKLMGSSSASAMDALQGQAYAKSGEIGDFNAGLLSGQADIAHEGIDFAASKEASTIGKITEAGRATLAAQRTFFAGGNLDPTFGSPLLAQALTAGRVTTDIDLAKASFAIDKANALTTEANIRGQAATSKGNADVARINAQIMAQKVDSDTMAGYFGAASSFLSGGAAIAKGGSGFNFGGSAGSPASGFSLTATGGLY